jgi:hypothetical protein
MFALWRCLIMGVLGVLVWYTLNLTHTSSIDGEQYVMVGQATQASSSCFGGETAVLLYVYKARLTNCCVKIVCILPSLSSVVLGVDANEV